MDMEEYGRLPRGPVAEIPFGALINVPTGDGDWEFACVISNTAERVVLYKLPPHEPEIFTVAPEWLSYKLYVPVELRDTARDSAGHWEPRTPA